MYLHCTAHLSVSRISVTAVLWSWTCKKILAVMLFVVQSPFFSIQFPTRDQIILHNHKRDREVEVEVEGGMGTGGG